MAYLERASQDFRVKVLIGKFEQGLLVFIDRNGLDKPDLARNLFDPTAQDLDSLARAAAAKEEEVDTWAEQLEELLQLSCEVADKAIARVTAVDSFAPSADSLQPEHEGRQAAVKVEL